MSEIKPRREFDEPLRPEAGPTLRATQAFDEAQAQKFTPVVEEEILTPDAPERVVENALKPRRSLWRRMVTAGLGIFGVSVVAQGAQWAADAWRTHDWIALGGCAAGGLIVAAGVGALASEWRRLHRLRERAEERDEARELLASHGSGKGRAFCEKLARQAGLTQGIRRWRAGTPPFMRPTATAKWSRSTRRLSSRCSISRRAAPSAARRRNRR